MIEARIISHSVSPIGKECLTFVATYPRFIHSEIMTHRQFSRNAASSRAIPVQRMIERILAEPAMPVSWGQNQKGMQADVTVDEYVEAKAKLVWLDAMSNAVHAAKRMLDLGIHKQIANRLLEPFAHMTTIITATEWGNFFNLRAHKDAQPEFQELAFLMLEAYKASTPRKLEGGQWHLPFCDQYIADVHFPDYITEEDHLKAMLCICTARCARVSYLNFEGDIDPQKDFALHNDLLVNGHMSPFEHAARAENYPVQSGNFVGFTQYRKLIANECKEDFNPDELLQRRAK